MRRNDREIKDRNKINQILQKCDSCRIGFYDGKQVYIVPLNYGIDYDGERYIFYFHSALEGRKIDLIRAYPQVGFEMDTAFALKEAEQACGYSAGYQSIIGNGIVTIVTDEDEKNHGLQLLMEHYTGKQQWEFQENLMEKVAVIKLVVEEISCKVHQI